MSANGMSILESMVLSPETLRKREFVMAIAPDLLAGGDPSGSDSTIPDIGFEETGDEIVMIDAPEDKLSEAAPAPSNDRTAPAAPSPRSAEAAGGAPTPKSETASAADPVPAPASAPVAPKADTAPLPTPERAREEARELSAPLETRAATTNLIQLVMGNAAAGVIGNVRPMGGAAELMVRAARDEQNKKDEDFMRSFARPELQERIDRLTAELAEIRAQITKNDERREEIRKTMEAREALRRLKAEGKFDPTDPAQRALLDAAGYTANDVRSDDFDAKSRRDDRRSTDEDRRIAEDTRRLKRDEAAKDADLRRAERDAAEMDARNARGEKPSTERFRAEAETVAGSRQIGSTIASAQRQEVKEALAEAVSSTEASPVRADSEAFTSNGVTDVAAVTKTGTADFDFDAPPAQTASADIQATDIFPTAPAIGTAFAEASGGTSFVQTAALTEDAKVQPTQTRVSNPAMLG